MNAYQSRYAHYYDLIYETKAYGDEVAFLDRVLQGHAAVLPKTWLDVACGTGNHAFELARRSYRVTGLDYSKAQLERARTKLERLAHANDNPRFIEADMCSFDLGTERFDVVSCLFDSLGYAVTNERVIAALRRMHQHLAPNGQVVLEFWHAAAMLTGYERKRVRRFAAPEGELVRTSETTLDVAQQTCSVKFTLAVPHEGAHVELTETHVCRFFMLQEMRALLAAAGLRLRHAYAGFDATKPISADTWHIVAIATCNDVA